MQNSSYRVYKLTAVRTEMRHGSVPALLVNNLGGVHVLIHTPAVVTLTRTDWAVR
jgi:hypothetical protein